MSRQTPKTLVNLCLASLIAGTAYGVIVLFSPTAISNILAFSSAIGGKFLVTSVFVSLEVLGIGMVKKSDRLAVSAILILVIGVLLGYFVL